MDHSTALLGPASSVSGFTAPGYEGVREAFEANMSIGEEFGGALAVHRYGVPVVDLTGGVQDSTGTPYREDALHVGYSVTKGVVGLVLAELVHNGELDIEAPVAAYWPEFAAGGKAGITVAELSSHQAGLTAFAEPINAADLVNWDECVRRLAAQSPAWPLGTGHGYHALTFGYLVGEVIRRATGRTVGQLLRDRFDPKGDLQAWIGLPAEHSSRVVLYRKAEPTPGVGALAQAHASTVGTHTYNTFHNPEITVSTFNDPDIWAAEVPGGNGIFDARSLSRLYSSVVDGPLRSISSATVDEFRRQRVNGADFVLTDQPTRFGTVFALSSPRQPMLGPGSMGHDGMGGHAAFAHPESGITFAYLSTRAIADPMPHPRLWRLISAVEAAIR
ncbi:serine hydrolase domain-containing protein [Paenarthrobacter sp. NPDC089316]|uniref:serine hydrolase domain-containing protein n=1 Tax=unclassified Paenarthrobacter TaxID=2634190 RepID=UPI00341C9003